MNGNDTAEYINEPNGYQYRSDPLPIGFLLFGFKDYWIIIAWYNLAFDQRLCLKTSWPNLQFGCCRSINERNIKAWDCGGRAE